MQTLKEQMDELCQAFETLNRMASQAKSPGLSQAELLAICGAQLAVSRKLAAEIDDILERLKSLEVNFYAYAGAVP